MQILLKAIKDADPVIANQAAASLGQIISRNQQPLNALRPTMLEAVAEHFVVVTTKDDRSDTQWGYRPVGNALLAFGDEGKAVLEKYMTQKTEANLADKAWRILYLKYNPEKFIPVTDEENDTIFMTRPDWLRKQN